MIIHRVNYFKSDIFCLPVSGVIHFYWTVQVSNQFLMYFSGAPKITNAPNSMRVAEGLNASFVCKASGYPQPTFHWEKKGKKFTTRKSLRYKVLSIPHGSVLRIEPIKKRKDIEDIQSFGMNMPFISSSEAKNAYFMSGEATNEIYIFSLHEMK